MSQTSEEWYRAESVPDCLRRISEDRNPGKKGVCVVKTEIKVPFSEEELNVVGYYPPHHPMEPPTPIYKTPVRPFENVKMFLADEKPLWMPMFTEFKMFNPSILADNCARKSVLQQTPDPSEPIYNKDYFGIEWEFVPSAHGSTVRPGAPKVPDLDEWEKYIEFPDLSKLDWAGCAKENAEYLNDPRAIQMAVFTGLFERLISFVGMEDALIAIVDPDSKDAVHRLFDRLCVFYDELFYYMAKWFEPDLLWFHDDWGSQRAPLFSLETCREMMVPYLKRIVDSAHKYGIGFELHCCGKNEELVPAMIEAGVDMWCGQPMNDRKKLYAKYGSQIKLGIIPPPFPKEDSDEEVIRIIDEILEQYPSNAYIGMDFSADPRYYPCLYVESRRKYNEVEAS